MRLTRFAIAHDALGGGDNRHPETTFHTRQLLATGVHAQSRLARALNALDDRKSRVILELHFQPGAAAFDGLADAFDIAFAQQYLGNRALHLGSRNAHADLLGLEEI